MRSAIAIAFAAVFVASAARAQEDPWGDSARTSEAETARKPEGETARAPESIRETDPKADDQSEDDPSDDGEDHGTSSGGVVVLHSSRELT